MIKNIFRKIGLSINGEKKFKMQKWSTVPQSHDHDTKSFTKFYNHSLKGKKQFFLVTELPRDTTIKSIWCKYQNNINNNKIITNCGFG